LTKDLYATVAEATLKMHVKLCIYMPVVETNHVLGREHLQFGQREMLGQKVPMTKFNVSTRRYCSNTTTKTAAAAAAEKKIIIMPLFIFASKSNISNTQVWYF
jgi:hypothetical protein